MKVGPWEKAIFHGPTFMVHGVNWPLISLIRHMVTSNVDLKQPSKIPSPSNQNWIFWLVYCSELILKKLQNILLILCDHPCMHGCNVWRFTPYSLLKPKVIWDLGLQLSRSQSFSLIINKINRCLLTLASMTVGIGPYYLLSLKSIGFGYMLSSEVVKVASIRSLLSLGWLHLDESNGVFGKCTKLMCRFGWQLLIVYGRNRRLIWWDE